MSRAGFPQARQDGTLLCVPMVLFLCPGPGDTESLALTPEMLHPACHGNKQLILARKCSGKEGLRLNSDWGGFCTTRSTRKSQFNLPGRSGPPPPTRHPGRRPPKTSTNTPTIPGFPGRRATRRQADEAVGVGLLTRGWRRDVTRPPSLLKLLLPGTQTLR